MEEALIQYKNVEIHQQELCVLSDVNLELHKGEFVYLIGKVGSGKTSLLKTFYGELDVIDGEAEVLGYNMRSIKRKHIPQLRRKLGIVFQDFQLLTDRTVYNNLEFVLRATGWKNKREIQERIEEVLTPLKKEYDYILIDCSPSLGLITINALTAADSVIIPVQAEYFALEGISKLLNTIKIIKSKLNPALEIEGFLLTMYDSRLRQANQIYDEVKRHFQELVFNSVIQRNVKLSEAPSYGIPTILYDADSTGAKNHLALAKEIINRNK